MRDDYRPTRRDLERADDLYWWEFGNPDGVVRPEPTTAQYRFIELVREAFRIGGDQPSTIGEARASLVRAVQNKLDLARHDSPGSVSITRLEKELADLQN